MTHYTMNLTRTSSLTNITHTRTIPISLASFIAWRYTIPRPFIQDAFPTLPPDDREFILTGITPEEWDAASPPSPPSTPVPQEEPS